MIRFTKVSFNSPDAAFVKKPLPPGRLALTNRRLIFFCHNEGLSNEIRKLNPSRTTQYLKNYWVDTSATQSFSFFPIDIKHVTHISFRMKVRIQNTTLSNAPTVSIMHIRSHISCIRNRIGFYLSRCRSSPKDACALLERSFTKRNSGVITGAHALKRRTWS